MLAVFYGTDTFAVRDKAHAFLALYEDRGATVERIEADGFTREVGEDLVGGTSLFGGETVYVLDMLSESTDAFAALCEHASAMHESSNVFVVIEGKLLKKDATSLIKHASVCEEINETKKGETFNIFALTDAFLRKDKKSLWIGLQKARKAGITGEQIIGMFFWQVKALRIAARVGSAQEAGVKPFVYTKATRALGKFPKDEADAHSRELIRIYHEAHRGTRDIDEALEAWVLSL